MFADLTGLRLGDISHLTWSDVHFESRLIIVRSSGAYKTKSGKIRTVPDKREPFLVLRDPPKESTQWLE